MTTDDLAGLTKAQRRAIIDPLNTYGLTQFAGSFGHWREAVRPGVAAALFRAGVLYRMRDRENPIHEPARSFWLYRPTQLGLRVRAILQEMNDE